ncbi:MAG: hypothetical protein K9K37_07595 [Desulfocapsa sp.]|nr:hypothetical protein [Desulfocapsa sp.]
MDKIFRIWVSRLPTPSWMQMGMPYQLRFTLLVGMTGNGTGSVTNVHTGISCGADCNESYTPSTTVSLVATPDKGSIFTGWSGACAGSGYCVATRTQSESVSANFKDTSSAALVPSYLLLATPHN